MSSNASSPCVLVSPKREISMCLHAQVRSTALRSVNEKNADSNLGSEDASGLYLSDECLTLHEHFFVVALAHSSDLL